MKVKKDSIYVITLIVFIVDQFIKFIIRSNMRLLESISLIPNFFSLTYIENKGAAFGVFSSTTWFLVIVSFIAFYFLLRYIREEKEWNMFKIVSFGFILGGLVGNLIDRLLYHSVTDYLDFNLFGYAAPIFNFADIMIVVGAIMVVIEVVRSEIDERRKRS